MHNKNLGLEATVLNNLLVWLLNCSTSLVFGDLPKITFVSFL